MANRIYFPYVKAILGINRSISRLKGDKIGEFASDPRIWSMKQEELKDLQFKAIKQSFSYHYNKCEFYRRYCEKEGNSITPESIKNSKDILKIPQLPTIAFKKTRLSSIPERKIKAVVTTSGTSGNPSYLVRDSRSLKMLRLFYLDLIYITIRKLVNSGRFSGIGEFSNYAMHNWYFGVFSPKPDESSTWLTNAFNSFVPFPKILSIPIDYYLEGFEFDAKKVLERIKSRNEDRKMMIFLGFHYVFNELMKYMDETGEKLELDPNGSNLCYLITVGGWKKLSGEKLDKVRFRQKLSEYFGIYDQNIIDFYGFGESNCLALDLCPARRMHIPPTALCRTRDPKTLEIQDFGEEGLLSAWDPTMHSFPSFVITDDIVKLTEPFKCECGLVTQTLGYIGRATGAELRSCGLKLGKIISEKDKKELEELKEKQKLRTGVGI
jgi:long-chain-fatty-acid---luciferin-component ligase